MSNYTKNTNFASKDTLPSGDSNKIVKGTEIDTEFNAIASAITSKADLASPTFTGTPAVPTATAGSNTTQIANTAFVKAEITTASGALGLGTMSTQNKTAVDITGGTIAGVTVTNPTITGGSITNITDITVADGGTGASDAAGARSNLGLVINTNVLGYVAPSTSGNVLTSNGSSWVSQVPVAPTTAQILTATAGITALAVGSYSFLTYFSGSAATNSNFAGSIALSDNSGNAFSGVTGTWKCMAITGSGANSTLFLRIA